MHDNTNSYYSDDYTIDVETLFLPSLRGYGTLPDLTIAMSLNSDLKELVADFVDGFSVETVADAAALNDAIREILYTWAGIESMASSARGPYIDARHVAFLEHMLGQGFRYIIPEHEGETNPAGWGAALLEHTWNIALGHLKSFLLLQSGLMLFADTVTYNPSTGEAQGDMALDHGLVSDLATYAPSAGSATMHTGLKSLHSSTTWLALTI